MLKCISQKYTLDFIRPGGTSRGILHKKDTWILQLYDTDLPEKIAVGECGMFRGLSFDDRPGFEKMLDWVCENIPEKKHAVLDELKKWPSIYFGVEMLLKDWENGASRILFKSDFTRGHQGITINGLIWMGSKEYMLEQIRRKIDEGFRCLKLKIGAIDFETELEILAHIRKQFNNRKIELRVDANGAFEPSNALEKLKRLAEFDIHSIEQPIKAGQPQEMAALVEQSPIPIALDEELIGITVFEEKVKLLETIHPSWLILKPSLVGGFAASEAWMQLIEKQGGKWWITSALESNIGLNAIAQFTFTKSNPLPQGLGTGQVFSNNFPSPLQVRSRKLFYDEKEAWDLSPLQS